LVAFVVEAAGAGSMFENEVAAFEKELSGYLRERVGETFVPRRFFISSGLPRTKSGKVVRRLLNRIAVGDADSAEDLSYLANPETVKDLIEGKGD
jgi:acetyl-CoA synthetase